MVRLVPFALVTFSLAVSALAQEPPPAATLGLADHISWLSDGAQHIERGPRQPRVRVDRSELIDKACQQAKAEQKLVLWYVPRIEERTLFGRQMYRAPVLHLYTEQVLFADPDVTELCTHAFVPVRCTMDQALSDRFGLRPLAFVEPAVVFLDGEGEVVHFIERIRTFHGQWFAALCTRVLDKARRDGAAAARGGTYDELRAQGRWTEALAAASKQTPKDAALWLQIARLQRLLTQSWQALDSVEKAREAALPGFAAGDPGERSGRRVRDQATRAALADCDAEEGLVRSMIGERLTAQPLLERAWRDGGSRAAEAGYWYALNQLALGDEVGAMRRFQLVAQKFPDTLFGKRARANTTLGPDDRPLGAAFTGFEALPYMQEAAYRGLQRDTTWQGDRMSAGDMARSATQFLLAQQRDDGGFTDARYAYWPNSEITPNVWVAITAIAATALLEQRADFPDLGARIDRALARAENFMLDEKRLNRGANEDCYSDAYRLMYLARRAELAGGEGPLREVAIARMNAIVEQAAARQRKSGFWAHEYENAFATGAVAQEVLAARAAGATIPQEMIDRAAAALVSARYETGSFAYGGAARGSRPTGLKDAAGRMPVCEGALLQLGHSDLDKLRFALRNFWDHMKNLEGVRRNDFHSDGELGGFFFFHAVFHASETLKLLPEDEREAHRDRFLALLQQIPEIDGSFLDSHELGRSYGTAMALLTLRNCRE